MRVLFFCLLMTTPVFALNDKKHYDLRIDREITHLTRDLVLKLKGSKALPKTIKVLLQTPGGDTQVMSEIIDSFGDLKRKGHIINCDISGAFSAGFAIASACNRRYANQNSLFLWHNAWVVYVGPINVMGAKDLLNKLIELQKKADAQVLKSFPVNKAAFTYLRDNNVIFTAQTANELVPGWLIIDNSIEPVTINVGE